MKIMRTHKVIQACLAAAIALASSFAAAPAHASHRQNSVFIDSPVLSRCNEHVVAFSGTATYDIGSHQLLIDLDGTPVYSTFEEPLLWSFLQTVSVGTHTLTARVHDNTVSQTVDHAITFEVKGCDSSSNGGEDTDTDCCPGPDEPVVVTKTSVKKPAVKGIRSGSSHVGALKNLAPLNSVFRSVFGRNPTFTEWKYWADRYLTDKPSWKQISGAMQWHKARGVTTGK